MPARPQGGARTARPGNGNSDVPATSCVGPVQRTVGCVGGSVGHHGPMVMVPSFVTHNCRAGGVPFRTLSDLEEPALTEVLAELASPQTQARSARRFGPRYLGHRRATEARLGNCSKWPGADHSAGHLTVSCWGRVLGSRAVCRRRGCAGAAERVALGDHQCDVGGLDHGTRPARSVRSPEAPDPIYADRVYRVEQGRGCATDRLTSWRGFSVPSRTGPDDWGVCATSSGRRLIARQLAEHVAPGMTVLDVGCGQGTQALRLAAVGCRVTGIDPSSSLLELLRADAADAGAEVEVLGGGLIDVAGMLPGRRFDVRCAHGLLMYLDDRHAALKALTAALAPTGLLSVTFRNGAALAFRPRTSP